VQAARVSVLETAFWVNWKHLLAAEEGRFDAGAGRSEDWQTIPCSDGHIALTFQDKDVRKLAAMTDDPRLLAPEFESRILRGRNIEAFLRIIRDWMRSRSRVEIVGRAKDLGIPIGPVLGMGELPADRQFIDRDFIERSADGRRSPRLPLLWNGVRPAASEGSESAGEGYA
jgi:crotonobetainyl-CoA:carnitine CoA-transferase CaiB-like acyl-CoA transferase